MKLLLLSLCLAGLAGAAEPALDPLRPAMDTAVARVQPALVRIQAVWVDYAQGREVKREISGSGLIFPSVPRRVVVRDVGHNARPPQA
jgi:hypothetical protein